MEEVSFRRKVGPDKTLKRHKGRLIKEALLKLEGFYFYFIELLFCIFTVKIERTQKSIRGGVSGSMSELQ